MAIWKFSPVNGNAPYFPTLFMDVADTNDLTILNNPDGFRYSDVGISATFLVQNMGLVGSPTAIASGTIKTATFRLDGDVALKATGLSVSAKAVYDAIEAHDEEALAQRLFEDADDITGTQFRDFLFGYGQADTIRGGAGNDDIYGGNGNDSLFGGGGRDALYGGSGNNVIISGAGQDSIYAGDGQDRIIFNTAPVDGQRDYIQHFTSGSDRIVLDQDIFTAIGPVGLLASGRFRLGTVAGDANDRIIYDNLSGILYYDRDGTGSAQAKIIAEIVDHPALTAADFQIIA